MTSELDFTALPDHQRRRWTDLAELYRELGFAETADGLFEEHDGDFDAAAERYADAKHEADQEAEAEARRDAEREAAEAEFAIKADNEKSLTDAIDAAVGTRLIWRGNGSTYARYRDLIKIRVSDHKAPEGGGYRFSQFYGRSDRWGDADCDFRYTTAAGYQPPTRAEIRSEIAAALWQARPR